MPNLICSQCNRITKIITHNWKLYSGHSFDQVCSIKCFKNWIKQGIEKKDYARDYEVTHIAFKNCLSVPVEVWSEEFYCFFRSVYEKDVAAFFARNGFGIMYESYTFRVNNSTYTPDFYLRDYDSFVEVKGIWNASAKTKYRNFTKLYPDVRMLLLDWRHHKTIKEV